MLVLRSSWASNMCSDNDFGRDEDDVGDTNVPSTEVDKIFLKEEALAATLFNSLDVELDLSKRFLQLNKSFSNGVSSLVISVIVLSKLEERRRDTGDVELLCDQWFPALNSSWGSNSLGSAGLELEETSGLWVTGSMPQLIKRFLRCVCQWFLISLSVLSGRCFAMSDHLIKKNYISKH